MSNRWNGNEKERWLESNSDGWDVTWTSMTTALEEEEIWIATLIVHVHTQPQSHPEQWKEMRGRERWLWVALGGGALFCILIDSWVVVYWVCDSYSFCCIFVISGGWDGYSLGLCETLLLFNLSFHSVLDSVVIVALTFLNQVVILLLSWCCVLLSSSFVVYWEWRLYSQVVHSDRVGYLESLSTCCSVIECIWHEI